jgi:hypothetical protein
LRRQACIPKGSKQPREAKPKPERRNQVERPKQLALNELQDSTEHSTTPSGSRVLPYPIFLQREPFEGQAPTEKTEVRILYDKHDMYFGICLLRLRARQIVARELRRDVPQELDDYFEIIIDSAHDRPNAYVFQINPRRTQRDALITEEQRTESDRGDGDAGWDGVWTPETRITRQGWTATIAIPFLPSISCNHGM